MTPTDYNGGRHALGQLIATYKAASNAAVPDNGARPISYRTARRRPWRARFSPPMTFSQSTPFIWIIGRLAKAPDIRSIASIAATMSGRSPPPQRFASTNYGVRSRA